MGKAASLSTSSRTRGTPGRGLRAHRGGSGFRVRSSVVRGSRQRRALRWHARGRPSAVLAECELIAPQLVAPIFALEGPELLVVVHLRGAARGARRRAPA